MRQVLVIFLLILSSKAMACDCGYNGPFIAMSKQSKLVVMVKVKDHPVVSEISKTPMAMNLEIIEVFKGREKRKNIIVWGDNGHLCRPFVSQFKKDSTYIMALDEGSEKWGQERESRNDYSISNCGAFWLNADLFQQKIVGDINSTDRKTHTLALKEFKSELLNSFR